MSGGAPTPAPEERHAGDAALRATRTSRADVDNPDTRVSRADVDYPDTRVSRAVDRLLEPLGRAASWLWIALLGVIVANVLLRYVFGAGRIEFEELQWHLYSLGFLAGLAVALQADAHIRVDVLRARLQPTTRAWVELYGLLLLLGPFVALVLWASVPFVVASFAQAEVSPSPGGLPLRWAIKAMLPLGFALLALAGLARLTRVAAFLFGVPRALDRTATQPPGAPRGAA